MSNASDKGIIVVSDTTVNISSPKELVSFAATLKEFILKEKLFTNISGKNFVHVEGWEFCGAAMGILPVLKETIDLSSGTEIKFKAIVELKRLSDGVVVGAGDAICSNKEAKRKNADEYVISSMAQTRAISKAYRNGFAWLMKMAGYEGTPAEEVDERTFAEPEPDIIQIDLTEVKEKVSAVLNNLPTHERLQALKEVRKMSEKSLSDYDWRTLYDNLVLGKNTAKPEQPRLAEEAA